MRDVAYIALGSNVGDRAAHLEAARSAIGAFPRSRRLAETPVEETAPIGPVAQGAFLNQMLALETELEPLALLDLLLGVERARGRERAVRWGPRTLDLDIVLLDRQAINHPRLTVPHPELQYRAWWQRELATLRPIHP